MRVLAARKHCRDSQAGFALIGVVMFVLVLTILGLSLFSLSSFEAQFMQNSAERSQCFHAAMGGLERAKWVLANTDSLQNVTSNLPRDSVDYAEARQGNIDWESANSSGPVEWNGAPVWIRVRATVGATSRTFEACFQPTMPIEVYRRLMTLSANHDSALVVMAHAFNNPALPTRGTQTDLVGEVWQNSASTVRAAPAQVDPSYAPFGGVPDPDLDSYFDRVSLNATPIADPRSSQVVSLNASQALNRIKLFKTFGPSQDDANWSVHWNNGNPTIQVNGTAIWMVDRGFWVDNELEVMPAGSADLLVLVAKPASRGSLVPHWDAGITLRGGLHLHSSVAVILVSDGRVEIQHVNNSGGSSTANLLSIFATHALVMGPEAPTPRLTLVHPLAGLPPQLDAIIDTLYELRLLPNTDAGLGARLTLLAGTWHELTNLPN